MLNYHESIKLYFEKIKIQTHCYLKRINENHIKYITYIIYEVLLTLLLYIASVVFWHCINVVLVVSNKKPFQKNIIYQIQSVHLSFILY